MQERTSSGDDSDDGADDPSFQSHTLELLLTSCGVSPQRPSVPPPTAGYITPSAGGFKAVEGDCTGAGSTLHTAPVGGQLFSPPQCFLDAHNSSQAPGLSAGVWSSSGSALLHPSGHCNVTSQGQAQIPLGVAPSSSKKIHSSSAPVQTPTDSCARLRAIRASAWYFAAYYEPFHSNMHLSPVSSSQGSRNSGRPKTGSGYEGQASSSGSARNDEACAPKRLLSFGWIAPVDLMRAHQWAAAGGRWEELQ